MDIINMGLIFKGNPPSFSGNIKAEVPTPTYSGKKSINASDSINPYTSIGPGIGGTGLTETEIVVIQKATTSGGSPAAAGPGSNIFSFTAADQVWTRPSGVTSVIIKLWGAGGGGAFWAGGQSGGSGGFTTATLDVTNHATLTIKVGGGGTTEHITGPQGAGWQDGGQGNNSNYPVWGGNGGGGGGRSAVRTAANDIEIICAGGGGGAGALAAGFQGNDNINIVGASFQGGAGANDSGGGGGGYTGGIGGGTNGGGTGGTGYTGHANLSSITQQFSIGRTATAPQTTDPDYTGNIATGALNDLGAGGPGQIIISWI